MFKRFFVFIRGLGRRAQKYEMPPASDLQYFRPGDVWWCTLESQHSQNLNSGAVRSSECRRPVLVYKKFSHNSFLGLQITKQDRGGDWYVPIVVDNDDRWVMLHCPITLEANRLADFKGTIDDGALARVRDRFVHLHSG